MAPAPPPPGPSGQLRAGGGETRKAGEGLAPSSTETLATRVTKGRRRAALDREGRRDCCNWSPSSLQALDSGMEGPWDQSCPAGGGRAGRPLPQSRLPPGSHCPCRAAGALHPAQSPWGSAPLPGEPLPLLLPIGTTLPQVLGSNLNAFCWREAFSAQRYLVGGAAWACSGDQWLVGGGS